MSSNTISVKATVCTIIPEITFVSNLQYVLGVNPDELCEHFGKPDLNLVLDL